MMNGRPSHRDVICSQQMINWSYLLKIKLYIWRIPFIWTDSWGMPLSVSKWHNFHLSPGTASVLDAQALIYSTRGTDFRFGSSNQFFNKILFEYSTQGHILRQRLARVKIELIFTILHRGCHMTFFTEKNWFKLKPSKKIEIYFPFPTAEIGFAFFWYKLNMG